MSPSLKILVSATAVIGLLTVTAFQQSNILSYKEVISFQSNKLEEQAIIIDDQIVEIDELTVNNTLLLEELNLVRDSISILQNDLTILKDTYQKSKKSIKAIEDELDVRQQELDFIKKELIKKKSKSSKEAALKEKVAMLEEQLEQLNYLQKKETEEFVEVENKIEEVEVVVTKKEATAEKMAKLKAILENTIIDFHGISLRTERDGDHISKLRKNGKNWKYTFINFDIQNAMPGYLVGAEFEWRITDMDTGMPISYIESNKIYPDAKDTKGLFFIYQGYAEEAVFINTQPKEGANYELKLFYLEDGNEFYVNGSSRPIVFDKHCID